MMMNLEYFVDNYMQLFLVYFLMMTTTVDHVFCTDEIHMERNTLIGVYSICRQDDSSEKDPGESESMFSKMATVNQQVILGMVESIHHLEPKTEVEYYEFEVCNSTKLLKEAAIEILLNKNLYFLNPVTGLLETKVMLIFVHLTDPLWQLFDRLLSILDVLIQRMEIKSYTQSIQQVSYSKYIVKYDINTKINILENIASTLLWDYVTVLLLNPNPINLFQMEYFRKSFSQKCRKGGKTNRCLIVEQALTESSYKKLAEKISRNQNAKVLILIGPQEEQTKFFAIMNQTIIDVNYIWVLVQYYNPDEETNADSLVINGIEDEVFFSAKTYFSSSIFSTIFTQEDSDLNLQAYISYYYSMRTYLVYNISKQFVYNVSKFIKLSQEEKFTFIEHHTIDGYSSWNYYNEKYTTPVEFNQFKNISCPNQDIICKPGTEKLFHKLTSNETEWQEEYGWSCVKCAPNSYKPSFGDAPCKPCLGLNVVNKARSSCYDPYQNIYLKSNELGVKICILLSSLCLVFTVSVLVIILKYRDTPVIRATDLKLSILHLSVSMALIGVCIVTFLGQPSRGKCMGYFIAPILYTGSASIVFVKSQKLLLVFKAALKIKKSDMLKTQATQVFVMILLTTIAVVIAIICIVRNTPMVMEVLDHVTVKRHLYCSNTDQNNIIIAFNILLQIGCLIQAFRARKLPDVYNTATSILYATLVTTIFFAVMFPIYYFQERVLDRTMVHWIILVSNNTILIALFYGKPMFIAVFHPELNNRTEIQQQIRENIHAFSSSTD